jgi:energy-coupling factor transporter transmembrane protein EcfT
MNAGLGWYEPGHSWLHRLDPRVKLAFVVVANALLVTQVGVWLPLGTLVAVHTALLTARVPSRRLLQLWRVFAPLMAMILLVQPLLTPLGDPLLSFLILRLTATGLLVGAAFALRLAALGFCWYLLLLTTRERDLAQALVRLGLPVTWGLVVALALRYPATLRELYLGVLDAQRARGLRLEGRGLLGRARAQLPVLIAMLVAALRSIDQLATALESRGFGRSRQRTSLHTLRFRTADWLTLAAVAGTTALLFAGRWLTASAL